MSDNTPRPYAVKNYVSSAVDEFVPPPPYVEVRPTITPTVETNLGFVLTLANLMVTAIIVIAMMFGGARADLAIVYGALYFAITMGVFALVVTGALTSIVNGWQHEATERRRIEAYQELGELSLEWRLAVEETRQIELLGRRPPTEGVQRTSPLTSYVAPFGDGERAQVEGVRFAMGLYDTHGRPDPRHVHHDGRLRGKMLGSKRGSGSRDAGRWLLRAGIIKRVRGGYALDISKFPARDSLRVFL